MLQFILGKPATGKTYTILNKIKELSLEGKTAILIVPEQYTFESERLVLSELGDRATLNVTVLSFTRLCDEIGNICGGISGTVLGDADKIIFMHRALKNVSDELKLWGRYAKNVNFAATMLDTVGEFKINAISPQDIRKAAEKVGSSSLKAKLMDIALIYDTYDILLGERFIDPADRLTKLYKNLEDCDYFNGKTVFFDSFKGFTGQQFKIISRILSKADDVYISLTDNPEIKKDFSVFTNIRKAAERIKKIASNVGAQEREPIVLNDSKYKSSGLIALEELLSKGKIEQEKPALGVSICFAATVFDEAEFTARTIRRLVRENGYRFKDFVIIARDTEKYEEPILGALDKNGISCFYDKRMPLSDFPMSVSAINAIKSLNFSTENILRFHKTGLSSLNLEEISLLENYTYLWNIEGKRWLDVWDMDVRGFVTEEETEESKAALNDINRLRLKAIAPLLEFKNNFKGNASNMASAIVKLFKSFNMGEKLNIIADNINLSSLPLSDNALKQAYDMFMGILDSLVLSFGESNIDREDFSSALNVAVSKASVGVIPQCLDQVTFGSADRIRPSRPKVAFILGANQGVFPKNVSNNGIFNIIERKNLIECDIKIDDNSVYSSIDEEYLVYCNLCCPSERLYISSYNNSLSGEKSEPSSFVMSVMEELNCDIFYEPLSSLDENNIPETAEAAYGEFCRRIRNTNSDAVSLREALREDGQAEKIDFINKMFANDKKQISQETAKSLFGSNIFMSATKLDTFNRCRFSFFCRYGLGAKKLQPADFDVLQRGTIVHYVLERFITVYKKDIALLEKEELCRLTDEYINEYLDSVSGFRSVETARTKFLVSRVSRSLKDVIIHMAEEFRQTDFEPVACELKIGKDGIPLEFEIEGGTVNINGSIDRVDEYNGFIRIIDYKTGSKSFKLPDILFGLNLQMLLYLYAVIRGRNLPDSKAAGILYMPAKRDTNESGMAMNGLLCGNEDLAFAMDKSGEGEFVPKLKFNKDGSLPKRGTSYITEEQFSDIFDYIETFIGKTGKSILSGDIAISPLDGRESKACAYCDFASVCGIEDAEVMRVPELNNSEVFEMMKGGKIDGN